MLLTLIHRAAWRLYAVCRARGECELLDFLQAPAGDRLAGDKADLLSELVRMAQTFEWQPNNSERTHIVDRRERIWQTGIRGVRVLWFYDEGRLMVFSHGFPKTTRKTPDQELDKARRAIRAYFRAKTEGNLHFLGDIDGGE
jgi:phage-related protein